MSADLSRDILVIDDDPILRDLLADWLEGAGYRVRKAADCNCGVAELQAKLPCLVVSDMRMPGPCGVAAIQTLKREHPQVRLIAISGNFDSGEGLTSEAALAAGADRALGKPVRRADFLRTVGELIGAPG